jgi:hypothetical protein
MPVVFQEKGLKLRKGNPVPLLNLPAQEIGVKRLYSLPEIAIASRLHMIHYLVAFTALTTGGDAF